MNNKIIILDEVLASKIAAGEVVERPASVVKELVENSIDAGASRISIEIHNGGKTLIRVTDDGSGMSKEDARLCVERHATSKINNIDDLINISTMGFRGEALPSIASVSVFELLTNDGMTGTSIRINGGKIAEEKEAPCPKGTSIIVKDLFFNTPARLKYMKTDSTELNHISDIVSKLALSNPNISFKLMTEGNEIISSSGSGDLEDAIASIYGASFTKNLLAVKTGNITGYVSKPSITKVNKDYQVFFVNGRNVKNFILSKALETAFNNLIPKDRHPIGILFIKIDPKLIDVNVHPAKKEIRFQNTRMVMEEITDSVRNALIDIAVPQLISGPDFKYEKKWTGEMETIWIDSIKADIYENKQEVRVNRELPYTSSLPVPEEEKLPVTPICQLDNTYIICTDGPDLVIIDQHAAHERILYEKIKSGKIGKSTSQLLLIPEIVELDKLEFARLESNIPEMEKLGFEIDAFGTNSLRVKALPQEIKGVNIREMIKDIVDQSDPSDKNKDITDANERLYKLMACHGAIKAGDVLGKEEIRRLITDIYTIINPSTCPHGRPSVVKIDNSKIAGLFHRGK